MRCAFASLSAGAFARCRKGNSDVEDNVGVGRRGVFLDLAGTLVEPLKPERLDEMTLIPGVIDGIARLSAAGFVCPVVTVQSRIAKGLWSLPEFERWFASFAAGRPGRQFSP